MKAPLLIVSLVLASLLVTVPVAAAGHVTMDLTVVGGGGETVGGSTVAVQFVALDLTNPARTFSIHRGNLVVDGVRTACTAISNVDCSLKTLTVTCANGDHNVAAGGPGVGSIDEDPLTQGSIQMFCFSR